MSFAEAVMNQPARTENGMLARKSTANECVDLFYKFGAMRGGKILNSFVPAFMENKDLAMRIAAWGRDIRGGAGERDLFKQILQYLELNDSFNCRRLIKLIPEIGRWDDLLCFRTDLMKYEAYHMIAAAIRAGNGLCAKWMPRKGVIAYELRCFMGMTPKQYRKTLVNLTKVVETQMCAKDWENINFSHVPSLASIRYKKAFLRNAPKAYSDWANKLSSGETKINAGAVYPYQVIREVLSNFNAYTFEDEQDLPQLSEVERQTILAQWDALENFVGDASILPMVDVSGSMSVRTGDTTALHVAVSLGLYLSEKNRGEFKDLMLTFSSTPELKKLSGTVIDRAMQAMATDWGMSTNLHAAFERVLETAVNSNVPQEQMPKTILILSDMQFNACVEHDDSAMQMIQRKYEEAGYKMPNVVFWNLVSYDNVPAKADQSGVALVSGFSPAIMRAVMAGDEFTPEAVMLRAVMVPRYDM